MDPKTRATDQPGARPAPPEAKASRAFDAGDGRCLPARGRSRCWACNAPDNEPVRLQRRVGERWVADATVQLCPACLAALRTPRLVRQLGLGRWRKAPADLATAAAVPVGDGGTETDALGETPLPLIVLKGA